MVETKLTPAALDFAYQLFQDAGGSIEITGPELDWLMEKIEYVGNFALALENTAMVGEYRDLTQYINGYTGKSRYLPVDGVDKYDHMYRSGRYNDITTKDEITAAAAAEIMSDKPQFSNLRNRLTDDQISGWGWEAMPTISIVVAHNDRYTVRMDMGKTGALTTKMVRGPKAKQNIAVEPTLEDIINTSDLDEIGEEGAKLILQDRKEFQEPEEEEVIETKTPLDPIDVAIWQIDKANGTTFREYIDSAANHGNLLVFMTWMSPQDKPCIATEQVEITELSKMEETARAILTKRYTSAINSFAPHIATTMVEGALQRMSLFVEEGAHEGNDEIRVRQADIFQALSSYNTLDDAVAQATTLLVEELNKCTIPRGPGAMLKLISGADEKPGKISIAYRVQMDIDSMLKTAIGKSTAPWAAQMTKLMSGRHLATLGESADLGNRNTEVLDAILKDCKSMHLCQIVAVEEVLYDTMTVRIAKVQTLKNTRKSYSDMGTCIDSRTVADPIYMIGIEGDVWYDCLDEGRYGVLQIEAGQSVATTTNIVFFENIKAFVRAFASMKGEAIGSAMASLIPDSPLVEFIRGGTIIPTSIGAPIRCQSHWNSTNCSNEVDEDRYKRRISKLTTMAIMNCCKLGNSNPVFSQDIEVGYRNIRDFYSIGYADYGALCPSTALAYITDIDCGRIAMARTRRNNADAGRVQQVQENIRSGIVTAFYRGMVRLSKEGKPFRISPYGGNDLIEFNKNTIIFNDQILTASNFMVTIPGKIMAAVEYTANASESRYGVQTIDVMKQIRGETQTQAKVYKSITQKDGKLSVLLTEWSPVIRGSEQIRIPCLPMFMPSYITAGMSEETNWQAEEKENRNHASAIRVMGQDDYKKVHESLHYIDCISKEQAFKWGHANTNRVDGPDAMAFDQLANRFVDCVMNPWIKEKQDDQAALRLTNLNAGTELTIISGTIGTVNFQVSVKKSNNGATTWYVNNKRIKRDEISDVLKRALCFETTEDFTKFVSDVSIINLNARDLITKGLNIRITKDDYTARYKDSGIPIFMEFDRDKRQWLTTIRNADGTVFRKHKIKGGISKFLGIFNRAHSAQRRQYSVTSSSGVGIPKNKFTELLAACPGLGLESVRRMFATGTQVIDKRIALSRKLLEDTAKETKAEHCSVTYSGKTETGYKVKGVSGQDYLVTCVLGTNEVKPDANHGSSQIGKVFALPQLRYICIVDKGMGDQSGYDIVVNRLYALKNDSYVAKRVTTLSQYTT